VTTIAGKKHEPLLYGRVTGSFGNHAKYSVDVRESDQQIQIGIDLESENGNYTGDKAYSDIVYGLRAMMKDPYPKPINGRDVSRLYGFYIKSTGKNNVGTRGKETLSSAVTECHISELFKEHCIKAGFTMERFPKNT